MRRSFALFAALGCMASAWAQPVFSHPERIRYDGQCFTIDGKDVVLFSGAFHYFRCPKPLWRERFRTIKNAGFNAVETYVAWNWHEREQPKDTNDFSKVDLGKLDEWLTMAQEEFGLYTIVRPGPYICAEWASGGYPQWLTNFRPEKPKSGAMWFRTDDPVYLEWCRHWYRAVCKVVAPHQIGRKPQGKKGVVLFQIENEYDFPSLPDAVKEGQLKSLAQDAWEFGIDVPLFTCWTRPCKGSKDPVLSRVFDNPNQYPRWNIDSVRQVSEGFGKTQPWAPRTVTEFQGGWFGQVGGLMSEEQDGIDHVQVNALTLNALAHGITGINYYMLFGGTNFGDWGGQGILTTYDYFAPIREWGGGGPKYQAVRAIGQFLQYCGQELARAVPEPSLNQTGAVVVVGRKAPNGTLFAFVHNPSRTENATAELVLDGQAVRFGMAPFDYRVVRLAKGGSPQVHPTPLPAMAPPKLPAPIRLTRAESVGLQPMNWRPCGPKTHVQALGIYDSRFVAYRAKGTPARAVEIRAPGTELSAWKNSRPQKISSSASGKFVFQPPAMQNLVLLALNPGWPNGGTGMEALRGVQSARIAPERPEGMDLDSWEVSSVDASRTPGVPIGTWTEAKNLDVPVRGARAFRTKFSIQESADWRLEIDAVDDDAWILLDGVQVAESHAWDEPISVNLSRITIGEHELVVIARNGEGPGGIIGVPRMVKGKPQVTPTVPMEWTDAFGPVSKPSVYGLRPASPPRIERPAQRAEVATVAGPLIRSRVFFNAPDLKAAAWELVLQAGGDGFLKLNGNPLGRFHQVGPQRGFFLPECWIKPEENVVEYVARPDSRGGTITAAELRPLAR